MLLERTFGEGGVFFSRGCDESKILELGHII